LRNEKVKKYGITVLLISFATLVQWLLWPFIETAPFILYYPTIILASLYGDGLSAILLSMIIAQYYFVPPSDSFSISWPMDVVRQFLFFISALMIRHITRKLASTVKALKVEKEKSQKAELWLSTTLKSIGDAVIATDKTGKVSFMNRVAEDLTQWTIPDAYGKPLSQVLNMVHQITREPVQNPVDKVLAEGTTVGLANKTILIGKLGKETVIEDSAAPIRRAHNGAIEGIVLVFRDSSEKYQQSEKLNEAFEQIKISEMKMSNILENALDAVVGMDDKGMITNWNSQAERIFGYTKEEAIGQRMSDIVIPSKYRERHENGMKKFLATGHGPVLNKRIEITAKRKTGVEFPIELSITPLKMPDGFFFAAFIRDISIEQQLKRELLLKSEAIENSLHGFDIVNSEGKFIYVNHAYVEMWGYSSAEEILGTSPANHCYDPTIPIKIITQLKETGRCDIEFLAKRKDGSTFDVRMLAFIATDNDGNEIYPTASIDISKDKKTAEELMRAKESAESANQSKSAFLANMSHEIRTPMTAVLGFTEILRDRGISEDEKQDALARIDKSGRALLRLIDDILDIAKVESGNVRLEKSRFSPFEVVSEVTALLKLQAEQKGIGLETLFDPSVPEIACSDPARVRQILTNLIGNAIKFTTKGTVTVHVKTEFDARGDKNQQFLTFEVTDTGIGISEQDQKRIFQPFAQADESITRQFGGTGLGLMLSKRLSQRLGGDLILLKSTVNEGSKFVARIEAGPFDKSTLKETLQEDEKDRRNKIEHPDKTVLSGSTILVVDDVKDNQDLLRFYLEGAGARVDVASDGQEAINKATHRNYEVILMDIQMPLVDGIKATKRLRASGYKRPILALTAHAMKEEVTRSIDAGCDEHLTKPVTRDKLISAVCRYLPPSPS
jgi:PAS domain S-box-containing protein